uniref:Histidine kinase/HSP90-like ATPase domain-containing protein n=1 Tax=Mucochytrium quahogii TaxID=96639 RepID=A0A7S2SL75_9STRA|mmetsp:Transcript_13644/g.22270  ORF Transcript_13644/g.22270 Transcript_13644/m.22270 type:complete len:603 (+) Transcript_13644:148-1956(+)
MRAPLAMRLGAGRWPSSERFGPIFGYFGTIRGVRSGPGRWSSSERFGRGSQGWLLARGFASRGEEDLELTVADPTALLNAIASNYKSTGRIVMEYVDNSIDSGIHLRRETRDDATIEVHINIDRPRRNVWIRDNGYGMPCKVLENVVRGVGKSNKKGIEWQNGQFGFGIHSFRAAAEKIVIVTKSGSEDGEDAHYLRVDRTKSSSLPATTVGLSQLNQVDLDIANASREKVFTSSNDEVMLGGANGTGTIVGLLNIDPIWFSGLRGLKRQIESHFEGLLEDKNLHIVLSNVTRKSVSTQECEGVDYSDIDGELLNDPILFEVDGKTCKADCKIMISKGNLVGRTQKVRFFRHGRCIGPVSGTHSFMEDSMFGAKLWDHPGVSGIIECGNLIEPVLTRDDFRRTNVRNAFYKKLVSMEPVLMKKLEDMIAAQHEESMSEFEDVLGTCMVDVFKDDKRKPKKDSGAVELRKEVEKEGVVYKTVRKNPPKPQEGLYDIRLVETSYDDSNGEPLRSFCTDKTIFVNVSHEDFQSRVAVDKLGKLSYTPRLSAYIANELAVYYQDEKVERLKLEPKTENSDLYRDLIGSINKLEDRIRHRLAKAARE